MKSVTYLLDEYRRKTFEPFPAYTGHIREDIGRMSPERHVKVFRNGRNQAVRIPREV